MKIIITSTVMMFAVLFINAQNVMKVAAGATLKTSGGATIVLSNMDLDNDGTINQASGEGGFRFTGNQASIIKGANMPVIGILEVNKTNGGKLLLNRNISVNSSINFLSGQLDLNGSNILMATGANIAGESENNRIIGPNGGFVEITQSMNAPASVNAGNLGATITSSADLGNVTVRRSHLPLSGIGLSSSINRYYFISPENNSNLNATLRLKYFDAELNGQMENALVVYQSVTAAGGWTNLSQTSRNTNANYVEKNSLASLALQTLANDNVQQEDGVTGLVFTGQRKKPTEVQLNWTSQTETNISGYEVQRKLDNEPDFAARTFVNSSAPGGNNFSQLSYQYKDANSHTGVSYYRLKIVTLNGSFTYSNVIAVAAKAKGGGNNNREAGDSVVVTSSFKTTPLIASSTKITVGPNPNNGNFWFRVNGIENEIVATLFTIDGKQAQQYRVRNSQQQKVTNLKTGIYLLKVPGFETQKIIVNSGSNNVPVPNQTTNNLKL